MPNHRKRPRDPAQLAKLIVDIATGEVEDRESTPEEEGKDPSAVALGRKGGKARAGLTSGGSGVRPDPEFAKKESATSVDAAAAAAAARSAPRARAEATEQVNAPLPCCGLGHRVAPTAVRNSPAIEPRPRRSRPLAPAARGPSLSSIAAGADRNSRKRNYRRVPLPLHHVNG